MSVQVLLFRPDGEEPEYKTLRGDILSEMQQLVGGYIETVWLLKRTNNRAEFVFYCNEDARTGSFLFNRLLSKYGFPVSPVYGNVVMAKMAGTGDQVPCSKDELLQALQCVRWESS